MKKLLSLLVFCLAVSITLTAGSAAGQGLFIGQEHAYDVFVRGNGEALVSVRVVVNNTDEEKMNSVRLEVPEGIKISELQAVQEFRQPECITYADRSTSRVCEEYKEPDYSEPYYFQRKVTFKKLTVKNDQGVLTVELDKAIAPEKNGAFLLAFVTRGFVETTFGNAFNFTAKSLKAEQRITQAHMAVYADTDYRIRGAKSDVDYMQPATAIQGIRSADSAVESSGLNSYIQTAGRYGHVNKTAQAMAPGDVLEVSGFAAQSWWRLYLANLLITALVLVLVAGGIVYWWRRSSGPGRTTKRSGAAANQDHSAKQDGTMKATNSRMLLLALLYGLVSALCVAALTLLLIFVENNLGLGNYALSPFLRIIQGIAVICAYLLAFLAPPVIMAFRYGMRWAIVAAAFGLGWLIITALVISLAFGSSRPPHAKPMPYDGLMMSQ